jgi:hypothetical protein
MENAVEAEGLMQELWEPTKVTQDPQSAVEET